VYQPLTGHLYPTHRLSDEWNLRNGIYAETPGSHRHHVDFDRANNRPTNITRMAAADHIRLHNSENYGEGFDPEAHGSAISEALERLAQDPVWRENFSAVQAQRARAFWSDERHAEMRARLIEQRRNPSEAAREAHRQATFRRYSDPMERLRQSQISARVWARDDGSRRSRQAEIARRLKQRTEITAEVVRAALDTTGSIRGSPTYRNHKVVAVREVPGQHDVYCLTVPEAGNFALDSGVFVSNCGIIVNVTPLEPEWEGHVTLEFSNTTPLPAKIYANEGVAQMLFFESDEVCGTSYKDRGGKYQGQVGVTLPKT